MAVDPPVTYLCEGRDVRRQAGRAVRAELNARLADALGAERVAAAASTLAGAMQESGALEAVRGRRVRPAQGLAPEGR